MDQEMECLEGDYMPTSRGITMGHGHGLSRAFLRQLGWRPTKSRDRSRRRCIATLPVTTGVVHFWAGLQGDVRPAQLNW
ncbi:unnamed protein product [Urochloa humidicola]